MAPPSSPTAEAMTPAPDTRNERRSKDSPNTACRKHLSFEDMPASPKRFLSSSSPPSPNQLLSSERSAAESKDLLLFFAKSKGTASRDPPIRTILGAPGSSGCQRAGSFQPKRPRGRKENSPGRGPHGQVGSPAIGLRRWGGDGSSSAGWRVKPWDRNPAKPRPPRRARQEIQPRLSTRLNPWTNLRNYERPLPIVIRVEYSAFA
jgi:hypothetical protein